MKKKILSLMAVFVVGILIFTGCGFNALIGGPASTDPVSSNGGMVVQKGNFLYFANGLLEAKKITDNKYGNVDYAGLYRTELDENGKLQYDSNGKLIAEVLAPKVVGFKNGSFYIFGDKIYYATPNTEKNASGSIDYTQTDFYYSNLDGTNVTRIYKTAVASTDFKFAFYNVNGKVVLAVYDSADLFMVDCESKDAVKVAEGVTSIALPRILETSSFDGENYVYYTRKAVDADSYDHGNVLAMASLDSKTEVSKLINATYTVKSFSCDNVIYTKQDTNDKTACYFVVAIANGEFDRTKITQISHQSFSNEPIVVNFLNGNYQGLIVKNESGYLTLVKPMANNVPEFEVLNSEVSLTPLAMYGDEIFAYNSDNELYKLNYRTKVLTKLTNKDDITLDFSVYKSADFDGRYVYVYQTIKGDNDEGAYLARIDTISGELPEVETLGRVLDKHIKTETEEDTNQD